MKIKITPQVSFVSVALLAVFSFTGYFSTNMVGDMFDQEPKVQETYVNGTPSDESIKTEMPVVNPYPNPFYDNQFYIDVMTDNPDFEYDDYRAIIYDLLGKQVGGSLLSIGRNTIIADGWKPGVYFVHVTRNEKVIQTLRVVKSN